MFIDEFAKRTDWFSRTRRKRYPTFRMKFFRTLFTPHDTIFHFLATKTMKFLWIASSWNLYFFRLDIVIWNILLFEILIINFSMWINFLCNLYCHILLLWSIKHDVVHKVISVGVVLENIVVDIILVRKEIRGHRRYWIVQSALRNVLVILVEEVVSIKAYLCFLIGIGNFWECISHQSR